MPGDMCLFTLVGQHHQTLSLKIEKSGASLAANSFPGGNVEWEAENSCLLGCSSLLLRWVAPRDFEGRFSCR